MSTTPVSESDLLWTPTDKWIKDTNLFAYQQWLEEEKGFVFEDYASLLKWSVEDIEVFWLTIWEYFDIQSSSPVGEVLPERKMPGAEWFPGVKINYAREIMRREQDDANALMYLSETTTLTSFSWTDMGQQVRALATQLRELGVEPGDRVAAYMPNIPQAVVALLATASIGAIWASCSPDFGTSGVLDRFSQIKPKVLICADGYRYGGKKFDRREALKEIIGNLDCLKQVIHFPYLDQSDTRPAVPDALQWQDVMARGGPGPEEFEFTEVPFNHPLWILFSSGTTGLPKPIIHSHGGILLEMSKLLSLMMDYKPNDRTFFFTTTGWMMWNFVVSSLLTGCCPVLYDGNPAYPTPDVLWKMAQDCEASFFGASPTYVDIMEKSGIVPRERYDLSKLRAVMPAGSPVSPECNAWFYSNVKEDIWVATGSGGTDCCTGFVGGVPTLPVYAGEIQAAALGVAVAAFDDEGNPVVNEIGELMITEPLPSMPIGFWGDTDNERYSESYFEEFPGKWRHGDLFRINERGGCFVPGRSDATLNRQGVRIGTAEIYRALKKIDELEDSLIVSLDLPKQTFFMPLFVQLKEGLELDEQLAQRIRANLREQCTPRHVPDKVIQVPIIPMTMSGKRMEVPVRKILMGTAPEKAMNRSVMADQSAMDFFLDYAENQTDFQQLSRTD